MNTSVSTSNPDVKSPTTSGGLESCPPVYAAEQDGSALGDVGARMAELSLGSITEQNASDLCRQEGQVLQEENDAERATEEQLEELAHKSWDMPHNHTEPTNSKSQPRGHDVTMGAPVEAPRWVFGTEGDTRCDTPEERLERRIRRFYRHHKVFEKLKKQAREEGKEADLPDVKALVAKHVGTEKRLFKALVEKYGPEPALRIVLRAFLPPTEGSKTSFHQEHAKGVVAPILSMLEKHAKSVGGDIDIRPVLTDHERTPRSSILVELVVPRMEPDQRVDENVISKLRDLLKNVHQIQKGNKHGLLMKDGGACEHERRLRDKEKTLNKRNNQKRR